MSIGNTTEDALMNLIFRAVAWANYADDAAGTPQTNTSVALSTADPDEGTQSTSETTYTSYARVNVARTTGGWSASTNGSINPAAAITFPAGTGGSGTVTHFSTGKTGGGASAILWAGTVTPNVVVGNGITPQLSTATVLTINASWIATLAALWFLSKTIGAAGWVESVGAMM